MNIFKIEALEYLFGGQNVNKPQMGQSATRISKCDRVRRKQTKTIYSAIVNVEHFRKKSRQLNFAES